MTGPPAPGIAWTFSGKIHDGVASDRLVFGHGAQQPLPGRFAIAGLVDAHAHPSVAADERGPYLAGRTATEGKLDEYAAQGVTVVRDVGGLNTVTLDYARSPTSGRPLMTVAGRFLSTPGRYFPRMYVPTSAGELIDAIGEEIRSGAQWVKIIGEFPEWGDGGPVPDSMATTYDLDTLRRAVAAAHDLGARVALHSTLPAGEVVAAGVDSVEHGRALTREDVEALGARAGAWTPTLCAMLGPRTAADPAARARAAMLEQLRDLLPHAVAHGVRVLAGTDVVGTLAGEIALLVECGLTVEQALAAAGSVARDYLGIHPQGDIVTYDADPRDDPGVLASPAAVVIRGVRVV